MASDRSETTKPRHWWDDAADAFYEWLSTQPKGVREDVGLREQIALYGRDMEKAHRKDLS